jgi:hypothetical protein
VLQREDLKLILMVREPQATIRSILRIGAGGIGTVDEAAAHYLQRLGQIRDYWIGVAGGCSTWRPRH